MTLWYASRAAGLVSLALLSATMVLGISGVMRVSAAGWPRFVLAHLHRNLSLLTLVFLSLHIATAVVDTYAHIDWVDTIVPFVSGYHPFWLGLGVVALQLLVALLATSLLRYRIGYRSWRAVHWVGYGCWPVAVLHGWGLAGSDGHTAWVVAGCLTCVAAVLAAITWRILAEPAGRPNGPLTPQRPVGVSR